MYIGWDFLIIIVKLLVSVLFFWGLVQFVAVPVLAYDFHSFPKSVGVFVFVGFVIWMFVCLMWSDRSGSSERRD